MGALAGRSATLTIPEKRYDWLTATYTRVYFFEMLSLRLLFRTSPFIVTHSIAEDTFKVNDSWLVTYLLPRR